MSRCENALDALGQPVVTPTVVIPGDRTTVADLFSVTRVMIAMTVVETLRQEVLFAEILLPVESIGDLLEIKLIQDVFGLLGEMFSF